MNRESNITQRVIKFRAWDKKDQVMRSVDEMMNLWEWWRAFIINQMPVWEDLKLYVWEECDIMQYTWLKDKNWIEVYEWDILRWYFNNWFTKKWCNTLRVVWLHSDYIGCFWTKDILPRKDDKTLRFLSESLNKDDEVIGNIYENPELLENNH